MYLSYLDESGTPADKNTRFFVLGGVTVFERQTHWLERELDSIAALYQNKVGGQYLELHASPMRSGKDGWERLAPSDRAQATADILRLLQDPQLKVSVFAAVVEKSQILKTADILSYCFEVLATKVDDFLALKYRSKLKEQARGIFVLDRNRAADEQNMQALHHTFKHFGHSNGGRLRNFAEVPLFVDSRATRLMQLADTICYWIFRRYESGDDRGWQFIHPHFANLGNNLSGLHQVLAVETPQMLANPKPQPFPFPPPLVSPTPTIIRTIVPTINVSRVAPNALVIP